MSIEFAAKGSPTSLSDAIEAIARGQGHVAALVVPWESTPAMLSMAVTSVKIDGWAIEHTNLGTITLTADGDATRVAMVGHVPEHENQARLTKVFERFAQELQQRLGAGVGDPPGDRP